LILAGAFGCTTTQEDTKKDAPKVSPKEEPDTLGPDLLAALKRESEKRLRVKGTFKATRPGVEGVLGSADLDVVAQKPNQLLLAVRSFFEQPVQIIASDGAYVTVYDALSLEGPRYLRGPADEKALKRILPISLTPAEVVYLTLGALVPVEDEVLDVRTEGESVTLLLARPGGGRTRIVSDMGTPLLREQQLCRGDFTLDDDVNQCAVHITWGEFADRAGLSFAQKVTVSARIKGKSQALVLDAKNVSYNGPPVDAALFVVAPPEGVEYLPL